GDSWKRLSDIINETTLMARLYFMNGLVLPRRDCWFRFTPQRNLLLAIKEQKKISGLDTEVPYLHVYSNAYFNSARAELPVDGTKTECITATNLDSILAIQRKYHEALALPGEAYAYRNGWLIHDLIPCQIQTGDVLEYIHDTSI